MNAAGLLQHYEQIADAPDAVEQLRKFVYDLAVSGKLTPFRRRESDVHELGKLAEFIMGQAPPGSSCNENGVGAIFVKVGEFGERFPRKVVWTTAPLKFAKQGDVLICVVGATIGKLNLAIDCSIGRSVAAIRPSKNLDQVFLFNSLMPVLVRLREGSRGSAQGVISRPDLAAIALWLPPLAEQHRIVAKVAELMVLCDQLEVARSAREAARDGLTAASLARLNAPDPETFVDDVRFALNALTALTARPDQINHLRHTILGLAMSGKLVPQDDGDESASALLARGVRLPDGYERRRKVLKERPVFPLVERFAPIPKTWTYADIQTLYDLNAVIDYADGNHGALYPRSSEFGDDGITFVTAKDLAGGRVGWTGCARLNEVHARKLSKGWARGGDVLLTHNATVGRVARVEPSVGPFLLGTSVTFYRLNSSILDAGFFYYMLTSTLWQDQLKAIMAQTTRNQVSIQKQAYFRVAIPPIAEQLRIVQRLDEVMALCDRLESSLSFGAEHRARMLEALLHRALRPAEALEQPA